jgi:hypothetical protein
MAKTIKKLRKKYWLVSYSETVSRERWSFLISAPEKKFAKAKAASKWVKKLDKTIHWEMWLYINYKPLKVFVSDNHPY